MQNSEIEQIVAAIRTGTRRSVARAMTRIENGLPEGEVLWDALYPHTGTAWRIGLTGPPGAGKSTLANALIDRFRASGQTVGVVAVDPTSPFTGGALLGDRIRMGDRDPDDGVFIRSVASRGALGGLSTRTEAVADVLDAAGFDIVLIETVGVGQAELDVAQAADTVVVVLVPESGDAVQAMKAGLMEIADVFAVNKSDHPEAGRLVRALREALHLRRTADAAWAIPVISTVSTHGEGIAELQKAMHAHRSFLQETRRWSTKRDDRFRRTVRRLIREAWEDEFWTPERRKVLNRAVESEIPEARAPHALAKRLIVYSDSVDSFSDP